MRLHAPRRWAAHLWKRPSEGPTPQNRFPPTRCRLEALDAKARFSELVRRAPTEGPEHGTVRGHDVVVVIAVDELEHLLPPTRDAVPFVAFMGNLSVDGLDLTRDRDRGGSVAISVLVE